MTLRSMCLALVFLCTSVLVGAADPIKVLIVDGQNNHDWRSTTPVLKKALEDAGLFQVDVATAPPQDTTGFAPKFSDYQAVLSNYNGADWPQDTQRALIDFVRSGGGLVIVHAANNSFPNWKEYNEMIGLGGWGGRNEKWGPYVRFRDGQFVRDTQPGGGGSHGAQHDYPIIVRDGKHPVTAGMPPVWMHVRDELYDRLRGPAEHMHVLATAYADPKQGGDGEHNPMIMVLDYGQGRVFHTPMGDNVGAMRCVGFITTVQRGTEWAATGKVTQKIPDDFPTADKTSVRN